MINQFNNSICTTSSKLSLDIPRIYYLMQTCDIKQLLKKLSYQDL